MDNFQGGCKMGLLYIQGPEESAIQPIKDLPEVFEKKIIITGRAFYFTELSTGDRKTLQTLMPKNLCYSEDVWVKDVFANGFSTALLRCYVDWAEKKSTKVFTSSFAQNILTSFGYVGERVLSGYNQKKVNWINQDIIFATIFTRYNSATNLNRFGLIGEWFKDTHLHLIWFGAILERYIHYCRRYAKE